MTDRELSEEEYEALSPAERMAYLDALSEREFMEALSSMDNGKPDDDEGPSVRSDPMSKNYSRVQDQRLTALGKLDIDWEKFAYWVTRPLELMLLRWNASGQWTTTETERRRFEEEMTRYVLDRAETAGKKYVADALMALQKRLAGECFCRALQNVRGDVDSAAIKELSREHAKESQEFVASLTKKWVFVRLGRPPARTEEEVKELSARLKNRMPEERAIRMKRGLPSTKEDVLPDLAVEFGMSVSSLEKILWPRKKGSPSVKRPKPRPRKR